MAIEENQTRSQARPKRGAIRLTFRSTAGKVELIKHERLDMICPQPRGERPKAGEHSGYWMELRGEGNRVLAYQLLQSPLRDSVAIHSPDRKITRVFGESTDGVFEVLLPDDAAARTVALLGDRPEKKSAKSKGPAGASELAHFELPQPSKKESL